MPQPTALNPLSTARTAGRSDWAERRFRRQPFILLSFSSSKKDRKAQEMQSYQCFQCIGHTGFNTSGTNGPHSLSRMKSGTHATPAPNRAHSGLHAETGAFRTEGAITTLGAFRTFTNIPGPGVKTANFAGSGVLIWCTPEERREPAGQRCAYARRCYEASRPRWAA